MESHLAQALESSPPAETALLLDPPAEGISAEAVEIISKSLPSTVVYVSCDPATLARDLKKLGIWYGVDYIQPVDLFPQTAEIEAAAKLKLL